MPSKIQTEKGIIPSMLGIKYITYGSTKIILEKDWHKQYSPRRM